MSDPVLHSIPLKQTVDWVERPGPGAKVDLRHDFPVPSVADDHVLVRLECTGVCHSDVHGIYGETPMETHIPGHEGVGKVVKLGRRVPQEALGVRVGVR